ncbi:MAG: 50S ribosomal protein L18 [Planctomycetota bacterium]|jgi:large subunit ribosomal protein L18
MNRFKKKRKDLRRRHLRVRRKLRGTEQKPRLAVYRSLKNIYIQIIDDDSGLTLASASTKSPEIKGDLTNGGNAAAAKAVGALIAKKAVEKNISTVVFDRGGRKYHGRIKALAEAAREGGLKF